MRAFEEYFFVEHLTLTCLLLSQNQVVPGSPAGSRLRCFLIARRKLNVFLPKPSGRLFLIALQFIGENTDISNETFEEYDRLLQKEQESLPRDFLDLLKESASIF